MTAGFLSVIWDVDPVIFSNGLTEVRYYGLAWTLAFLAGAIMFYNYTRKDGYSDKVFVWLFFLSFFLTITGSRAGHCLFYDPVYYLAHPGEILKMSEGGMASHGAAMGLLAALLIASKVNRIPYLWTLDRVMMPVALGGALVRIGNLMNSEIYGTATDAPWGFIFVRAGETVPKHPTQIYEAICYLLVFILLTWLYYRRHTARKYPGFLFGAGLTGIFLSRFLIEFIKNPQTGFEGNMTLNMGQWLSIPFILAGIYMICRAKAKKTGNSSV